MEKGIQKHIQHTYTSYTLLHFFTEPMQIAEVDSLYANTSFGTF